MACEHDNAIKIFRGDDTNWNDEVLLSFQVTSETADLSTMTAEFILGGIKKTNISLADSGEFEISLSHAETSTLPWGLNNGILKIYDAEKRIKTVANNIPFWVTDDPVGMQSGTIVIPVPETSAVSIVLQVGIKYVTEEELQAVQADLQAQIDGKQPAGNYATVDQLNTGLAGKQDKLTQTQLDAVNSGANAAKIGQIATNTTNIGNEVTARQNADLGLQNQIDALAAASDVTDIVGTYADLQAYDTQHLKDNDIIKVITDSTHNNASSYYRWSTHTDTFTYIGSEGPYTTPEQLQAGLNTKLDITAAASTYATQTALSTGLAGKQDTLSTAQLAAVNSGVTTSTVSQVATNLSYLTGFAPYIQKYEVGNFLTQQTVDATDLLSATGALHALDLDLSTNTQLKKLTAKGTSGNLANVSRVLVSNEAPFDNATSPQLDVSYTGLNRAALVNLFNSMPYNVGYTVVGSPTITDGVVSGFSGTGYLQTSLQQTEETTSFEWNVKFNTGTLSTDYSSFVLGGNSHAGIYVSNAKKLRLTWLSSSSSWIDKNTNYDMTDNTTYTVNLKVDNVTQTGTVTVYSENGTQLFTDTYTSVTCRRMNAVIWLGMRGGATYTDNYWRGSVDLNNTYIKVNGVPWFTGKAAMTKTCSVVGCTGTADLTQDDKNIALNKGWALTVA